jgi:hypothetical protein
LLEIYFVILIIHLENLNNNTIMLTFDYPIQAVSKAQRLVNLCFDMMQQTAELHNSGQYVSLHDLEVEEVQQVNIEGCTKVMMEVELPALCSYPPQRYLVATLRTRFEDGCSLSEIRFFSKHY